MSSLGVEAEDAGEADLPGGAQEEPAPGGVAAGVGQVEGGPEPDRRGGERHPEAGAEREVGARGRAEGQPRAPGGRRGRCRPRSRGARSRPASSTSASPARPDTPASPPPAREPESTRLPGRAGGGRRGEGDGRAGEERQRRGSEEEEVAREGEPIPAPPEGQGGGRLRRRAGCRYVGPRDEPAARTDPDPGHLRAALPHPHRQGGGGGEGAADRRGAAGHRHRPGHRERHAALVPGHPPRAPRPPSGTGRPGRATCASAAAPRRRPPDRSRTTWASLARPSR